MIDDKMYAKRFLQGQGINVALGRTFTKDDIKEALLYAGKIGYPVVLKPTFGSHGDNVYLGLKDDRELERIIAVYLEKEPESGYFLIEKQCPGQEYRIFVARNGFFAAVKRIPANITGNGRDNVLILIQSENKRRMNPRNNCLCEIRLDDITFEFMEKNNLTVDYVPGKGEKVFLRGNSNVSTGGNCYDVTNTVHPSGLKLAKKILNTYAVPFIGIDLLTADIAKDIKDDYVICEVNSAPGLSLHMLPEKGLSRNVAGAIVDLLF
jgi:cyanophycin synthetase